MKSVRELLLERHRDATPRLDAVRAGLLLSLDRRRRSSVRVFSAAVAGWWGQWFGMPRRLRLGLAVTWLMAALLQGWVAWDSRHGVLASAVAGKSSAPVGAARERAELRRLLEFDLHDVSVSRWDASGDDADWQTDPVKPLSGRAHRHHVVSSRSLLA